MSQVIYDDPVFFAGYSGLGRSCRGLAGAPEWPTLRAMLPPLAGKRVIDLGCGFGWFARFAAGEGAAEVLALDLSERMLERARLKNAHSAIRYERRDLDGIVLAAGCADLVYSSLALHYLPEVAPLFAAVRDALVPGGRFVFSTEHPILMASRRAGWLEDPDGRPFWPVDSYCEEGPRITRWFTDGVVKYHRTLATTLNALLAAGFALRQVEEFGPSEAQSAADPALAKERERPMFLLVSAERI